MKRLLSLFVLPVALGVSACGTSNLTSPEVPGLGNSSGGAASAASDPGLLGAWKLFSMQPAGVPAIAIPGPAAFTAEFTGDGALHLRADCNRCNTRYEASSSVIKVTSTMACTRAYCSSAPLDTQYVDLTGAAIAYAVSGNALELRSSKGTLQFRR